MGCMGITFNRAAYTAKLLTATGSIWQGLAVPGYGVRQYANDLNAHENLTTKAMNQNCRNCGAPIKSDVCEYCKTRCA